MPLKPLFSIVIATKNVVDVLPKCLESIKKQDEKDYEILIVDALSEDGTREIISNNKEYIAWWVSERDGGIYDAWNKAIKRVRGEWIYFIGADDELKDPGVLRDVKHFISKNKIDSDIVYGKVALKKDNSCKTVNQEWTEMKEDFARGLKGIHHQGVFQRRAIFDNGVIFNPEYKIAADEDFIRKIVNKKPPVFINRTIACVGAEGISAGFYNYELLEEKRRIFKKYKINIGAMRMLKMHLKLGISYLKSKI